jgi:hypothetical protein
MVGALYSIQLYHLIGRSGGGFTDQPLKRALKLPTQIEALLGFFLPSRCTFIGAS